MIAGTKLSFGFVLASASFASVCFVFGILLARYGKAAVPAVSADCPGTVESWKHGRLLVRATGTYETGPIYYRNDSSHWIQYQNPGPGASQVPVPSPQQTAMFGDISNIWRDTDGSLALGLSIPDTNLHFTTMLNPRVVNPGPEMFIAPAVSSSRPSRRLTWTAYGAGTFSVETPFAQNRGALMIRSASSAGDGGMVRFDYLGGRPLLVGDKMFAFGYATQKNLIQIEVGFRHDDNNCVNWLVQTDSNGVGTWRVVSIASGVAYEYDTGLPYKSERIVFGVEYTQSDRYNTSTTGVGVDYWLGTAQNAMVRRARIDRNLPSTSASNMHPFFRVLRLPGSSANAPEFELTWLYPYKVNA